MNIEDEIKQILKEIAVLRTEVIANNAFFMKELFGYSIYKEYTEKQKIFADATLEKRLEAMNEFRAQLDKQAITFVTNKELTTLKAETQLLADQVLQKNILQIDKLDGYARRNMDRIEKSEVAIAAIMREVPSISENCKRIAELFKLVNRVQGVVWLLGIAGTAGIVAFILGLLRLTGVVK